MKRVILDTNIYGRIVDQRQIEEMQELAEKRKDIVIYGYDVVRKELRATSKKVRFGKRGLRILLLGIYDALTQRHIISTSPLIKNLAEDYYVTYKRIGGRCGRSEIFEDFLIVACASIHELDIVVSEDNKTMRSSDAISAYEIVNRLKHYRLPNFISYDAFRRLLVS